MYVIKEAGSHHFILPFSCKQKELKLLVNKAFKFKLNTTAIKPQETLVFLFCGPLEILFIL